ncbi:MAG: type II secretion system protein [Gemmatimonadaceae bacterium]|nr:type II secretion system protein [Gemmatimonadaceae bacterium]
MTRPGSLLRAVPRSPRHRHRARRGTSLAELLVALSVFGAVATACLRALASSTRWYERTTLVAEQHAQVDAALRILTALPSAASPADGDLLTLGDSALTWSATVAAAVACRETSGALMLPRAPLISGVDLAGYTSAPQVGDVLVLLDDAASRTSADDRWNRHAIVGVGTSSGGCVGGQLADAVRDAATPAWRLDLVPPATAAAIGAPVRILRPRRFLLYLSTPDWMLGVTEFNAPAGWATVQPAAGPLAPPRAAGLKLRWLDSLFRADSTRVAAIGIDIQAPTRRNLRPLPGGRPSVTESLSVILALRNRP